jgi:outer membrane protein TolC
MVTMVVWVSRPALAQEPLKTVALDQAIQLALAHNTDSRSADEDVTSADGALVQSRLFSNPSLFVSSLGRGVSPFMGPAPTQYGVTWTIPIGGKRAARSSCPSRRRSSRCCSTRRSSNSTARTRRGSMTRWR